MRTIYAIPNYECNLNCPHCDIHTKHIEYNECEYLKTLKSIDDNDRVILFGGEPTLYEDRFYSSFFTGKLKSISTNLVDIQPNILKTIAESNMTMSTSWNVTRFTDIQYKRWLDNLQIYGTYGKKCMVMITMTEDLIDDANFDHVLTILKDIDDTHAVDKLQFEHLLSQNDLSEHHIKCDEWLCKIHDIWNFSFENCIETKINKGWIFDCKDIYTLYPDGRLINECPHGNSIKLNLICITCSNAKNCKPCKLQNICTFPYKLSRLLNYV